MNIAQIARRSRMATVVLCVAVAAAAAGAAERKEFRFNLPADGTLTVVNPSGSVTLRPGSGREVVIAATPTSDKAEVDATQAGNRIDARTHFLQKVSQAEARVDYEISVPADVNVEVRALAGPIRADGLKADLRLEGDTADVSVTNTTGALNVRTLNGPITVRSAKGRISLTSTGGNVTVAGVSGPKIDVNTTTGAVSFQGDFSSGSHTIMNHSGTVEVVVPAAASVDVTARSINGSVQNELQLKEKAHTTFVAQPGRSISGMLNAGHSSLEVRSFSGKITIRKQ